MNAIRELNAQETETVTGGLSLLDVGVTVSIGNTTTGLQVSDLADLLKLLNDFKGGS